MGSGGMAARQIRRDAAAEEQHELNERLHCWSEFIRDVDCPADLAAVISTGRSQLLPSIARDMTKAEVLLLLKVIGVYMDTNQALQKHSAQIGAEMHEIRKTLEGMASKSLRLERQANFQDQDESDEEDGE